MHQETTHMGPERTLLTVPEAAAYLGIKSTKGYEMASRGELPGVVRIGRLVKVHLPTLDSWLAEQAAGSSDSTPSRASR